MDKKRDIKGMGEKDKRKRELKRMDAALKHIGKNNPKLEMKMRKWMEGI